jgi:hypothetical protein
MLDQIQAALGPEVLAIIATAVAAVIAYLRGDMSKALSSVVDIETQLRNLLAEEFASVVPSSTEVRQEDITASISGQYGPEAARTSSSWTGATSPQTQTALTAWTDSM